jgi:hypothetical protein
MEKHYIELSSTKYLAETLTEQARQEKKRRNREALHAFFVGTIAIAVMGAIVYSMPIWVPEVANYLSANGWNV